LSLLAGDLGVTPEETVRPQISFELALLAQRELDPWTGYVPEARAEVRRHRAAKYGFRRTDWENFMRS
jgi:hypothetical protein